MFAPGHSYHTKKWFDYFRANGNEVYVVSFTGGMIEEKYLHLIDTGVAENNTEKQKIKYLFQAQKVKKAIEDFAPDIISVHRASSYGTVAALAGLEKYVLSVWGEDIYSFPKKSPLHKAILKYSLRKASVLFSTSNAMAEEAGKYTNRSFEITPFGVDMNLFSPSKRMRSHDGRFIVGTVKALSPRYGIDNLMKAVAIIRQDYPEIPVELRIAGRGSHEAVYKQMALELGIANITTWLGFIPQEEAAREWANMDCAIIPSESESESFGVSAVEAQACGIPVIITDIPGLKEATIPGVTSIVVPRNSPKEIAKQIARIYNNTDLCLTMGKQGRAFVLAEYEMNHCFQRISNLFSEIIC